MTKKQMSNTTKKEICKNLKEISKCKKPETKKAPICNKKIFVEYFGKQISSDAIIEKFKLEWMKEHNLSDIKDLKTYYKIEEDTAYFVVNNDETLSIKMC